MTPEQIRNVELALPRFLIAPQGGHQALLRAVPLGASDHFKFSLALNVPNNTAWLYSPSGGLFLLDSEAGASQ